MLHSPWPAGHMVVSQFIRLVLQEHSTGIQELARANLGTGGHLCKTFIRLVVLANQLLEKPCSWS